MPLGTLANIPRASRMWEDVYQSALERGFSEQRAAQQAWGAVKNAGYYQGADGVWRSPANAKRRRRKTSRSASRKKAKAGARKMDGKQALRAWQRGEGKA